jgi:hypothetical protein
MLCFWWQKNEALLCMDQNYKFAEVLVKIFVGENVFA